MCIPILYVTLRYNRSGVVIAILIRGGYCDFDNLIRGGYCDFDPGWLLRF